MTKKKELTNSLTSHTTVYTEEDHIQLPVPEYTQHSMESISEEYRREMIAICAYFIAEQRDFTPGYEERDWLTAEAEINTYIN